jgi:hypothetical protein
MQNSLWFLNQYVVCIKLILFVADTELELGVAKKKMADSEVGLFFAYSDFQCSCVFSSVSSIKIRMLSKANP